jgi:hypothetical protein
MLHRGHARSRSMPPEPDQPEGPADADGGAASAADDEVIPATTPEESIEKRALHEVVHLWIPLAIVFVSVCAAIVGWRASLADESATHYVELSRQDLIQQQQQLVQDNSSVDADVATFGQFTQDSLLAHSLLHDATTVGGALGDQLRVEGKQIQNVSYAFDPSNPTANPALYTDGTYKPGFPYDAGAGLASAENGDFELHGLEPDALLSKAESQHTRGVDFTGIAALFIGVLVLLTLGAVVKGQQKLWFAGSGLALGSAGVVLFLITQFS